MEKIFNNGVMDERIVRLNEFKAVKMSSISKSKRPAAKFNKEVANYLLDNWDNIEQLKTCVNAMRNDAPNGCEEVMNMYDTRISELEPKKGDGGEKSRRGRKSTHYVGEVHPVNPNWTWMEYLPGKFGWKSIRGKQGREQFPDRVPVEFKMPKKEVAGKAEKAKPAAAPKLTLTKLLAKPTPSGLSKAQQNVIKALKKGFRLRKDGNVLWLTDAAGNNERTEKGVLEALQRRYKIDYIPNDIWYK